MKEFRTVLVTVTRLLRRGLGQSEDDPIRIITQIWDEQDRLILEWDPLATVEPIGQGEGFNDFVMGPP